MKKVVTLLCVLNLTYSIAQVGIQTDTPKETLDVKGTAKIQELPETGIGKIYDGTDTKETLFTGKRTVITDENGVLGYKKGVAYTDQEQIYTAGQGIFISPEKVISRTGLEEVTEGGKKGWRLVGADPEKYGYIGDDARDLSVKWGTETKAALNDRIWENINNRQIKIKDTGATGGGSVALGTNVLASGGDAVAMGYGTRAVGENTFAVGEGARAFGFSSVAIGAYSETNAFSAVAIGSGLIANNPAQFVTGSYNYRLTEFSKAKEEVKSLKELKLDEEIFVIGNGSNSSNRSNAIVTLRNGKTGINLKKESPKEMLDVNGAIKIGGDASYTPTADATSPVPNGGPGTIVFSNGHFYGWNGNMWKQLDN